MNLRYLWRVFGQLTTSVICAGIFYFIWLATFLLTDVSNIPLIEIIFWILTPIVTATGFAAGFVMYEWLASKRRIRFLSIFIWPLIGCSIGAGVVYWFGPMLIVFGMFVAGTVSITLRELVLSIKTHRNKKNS